MSLVQVEIYRENIVRAKFHAPDFWDSFGARVAPNSKDSETGKKTPRRKEKQRNR